MRLLRRIGTAVVVLLAGALVPLALGGGSASAATPSTVSAVTPYLSSVAIAPTADGQGYWLAGLDGGIFSFGDAQFYGSLPGLHIAQSDIVGMAATPPTAMGTGWSVPMGECSASATPNSTVRCRVPSVGLRPTR
jgi:hypothetical protein